MTSLKQPIDYDNHRSTTLGQVIDQIEHGGFFTDVRTVNQAYDQFGHPLSHWYIAIIGIPTGRQTKTPFGYNK